MNLSPAKLVNPAEEAYLEATYKLLKGDYERGLQEYELRWKTSHSKQFWNPPSVPQWTGQPLEGKRLFIWSEQGLGDAIMMHRYIAKLPGSELEIQPPLVELFRANLPGVKVLDAEQNPAECDYHCPTMSLPYAFGTKIDTIPPPAPIRPIKPLLVDLDPSVLHVGVQWAGNIQHPDDMARSIPFWQFARLLRIKGIKFWGLQRNIRKSDIPAIRKSGLECLWFDGFSALASIVDKMDVIVTVDTALAHIAGAMGKPTWIFIQGNPDWRWLLDRVDSPWYPTVRLFRQRLLMDWRPPLDHVAELLRRKRDAR